MCFVVKECVEKEEKLVATTRAFLLLNLIRIQGDRQRMKAVKTRFFFFLYLL